MSPASRCAGERAAAGAVAIVILAAGRSRRLGTPKQLLPYRGRPLLVHAVRTALASGCRPVVLVLGSRAQLLRRHVRGRGVDVVENPGWREGMASSIRAGIARVSSLSPGVGAAIIMVCDQPLVTPELLGEMAASHRRGGSAIVACEYAGTRGVPALFDRRYFHELLALEGAEGARRIIAAHASEVRPMPFPGGTLDIDTAEDRARLREDASPRRKKARHSGGP